MSLLSILVRGREQRPSPDPHPEPSADAGVRAYPSVDPGVQVRSIEDILAAHQDLISRIKLCYGSDREGFEVDLLVPIRNYAGFVNLLPATADNFFCEVGGLFRLGLEVAFFALQGTDGHIVSGRSTISTRRQLEPRWRHATFIAGLCSELHRTLSQIVVTDGRGDEWPAYLGPLSAWLAKRRADRFFIRWIANTQESRALGLFALPHIVPAATMQHLATANTVAVPQMLSCLSGAALYREQNVLVDLVKRAAALVIDRDLIASANRYGRPILGAHLERYLIDAMRRLIIAHPAWIPNHERSRVWYGRDGLFIVWPNAVQEIRKLLEGDELPGIPKAPDTILEILLGAGVFESRGEGQPLWPIEPPPGKSLIEAVKLAAPEILLPNHGQSIPALAATLVVRTSQGREPGTAHPQARREPDFADDSPPLPVASPPAPDPAVRRDGEPAASSETTSQSACIDNQEVVSSPSSRAPSSVPAAPVSMPSFKLIAPLRLNPAVRDALSAAIVSMNGDARAADAITVSAGVFVPLDHFKRRRVDVPLVLRSLAETGMTAGRGTAIAGTVQHEIGGRQQTGLVIKAGFVEGLDPSDFAPLAEDFPREPTMLVRPYEMPWRPAYEIWAAVAWIVGLACFVYLGGKGLLTVAMALALAFFALLMAAHRLRQGLDVLTVRASLSGKAMQVITTAKLEALTRDPGQVFLGFGFEWLPVHSQRLYELAKINYKDYAISPTLLRLLGYAVSPQPDSEIGLPFIHGVEPREKPLYRPLQNFEGGTLLVGTTQAGKGVALGSFLTQAIRRGDVVVFIDPKNSRRLKRVVQRACSDYREADTFQEFHPAFPELGVRLDFTFNWQKPTEIASRIQSVMPVDTGGAFTAFGWDAVNVVVQGLISLEDRPNLIKLTKYIEGGIEPVLEASLLRFFDACLGPAWRDLQEMRALMQAATRGQIKKPSEVATPQLMACVSYYEQHVPQNRRDKVIDSQIRVFRHNREHYQKITANLLPVLSMLTSGDLGASLSPDPFDLADRRPIMNFEKIERGGHVLYMCLDSLPDPSVASAIGALAIADLAARAGMRYNLGIHRRITLVVDEVANVINQPLIEILNKGAEGGIHSICAMQTLADLAKRLGSEDAARMALGNLNNLFALRSKDRPTQDFIVETFGKTGIHTMRVGINQGADTHLGDWSAGKSVQLTESMEERVPVDILGKLPNLQYFGSVAGRLVKGRFAILDPDFDRPTGDVKETA